MLRPLNLGSGKSDVLGFNEARGRLRYGQDGSVEMNVPERSPSWSVLLDSGKR